MRAFWFLVLFFNVFDVSSQELPGIRAKIMFNDGAAVNEVNGYPVKLVNTLLVRDRFGNRKSAAYMHGSPGSYINLGSGNELKPENGSISLWFKIEVIIPSGKGYQFNPIILTKNGVLDSLGRNDDFFEAYAIAYDIKVHRITVASSQSEQLQVNAHSADTINLYRWHHVVLTYDYNYLTLYLDGVLNARLPKNFKTVFSKTDSVMIGNTANKKNDRYLCGAIDDIQIYDRVLSSDEVSELYQVVDHNRYHRYFVWLKWLLIVTCIIAFVVWFILIRLKKKVEREAEQNRLNARMNELETLAIRTQMNPHFMFNALNTLQRFILEEDTVNANAYLVRFSGLLRKLLESSLSESISLKEEMDILRDYIEIEKLRFDGLFEFKLETNLPDPDKVQVPFMLVQPFIENAIWHGLLAKNNLRILGVQFLDIDEKTLLCRIEDNGIGRKSSLTQKNPFRKKSMAIEFVNQRLEILGKAIGVKCLVKIVDKEDSEQQSLGTLVEITMPKLKHDLTRSYNR